MDCILSSTQDLTEEMQTNKDKSILKDDQNFSASNRQKELLSTKGQSLPSLPSLPSLSEVNTSDNQTIVCKSGNNESIDNKQTLNDNSKDSNNCNNNLVLEEKRGRSLRWRHLRDVQQLKSDNLKLSNEFNRLKRSKTRIEIKNKRFNQLISENERLKNELLFSRNLNEILVKIKEYYETNSKNLLSVNSHSENENILNNLLNQYKRVSNQSQTNLKYKSVVKQLKEEFNSSDNKTNVQSINVKRQRSRRGRRGRPSKQESFKRMTEIENSTLESQTNESQISPKRSKSSFRCDWPDCSYQCSRTKMLTEHINSAHTGERPYICPIDSCMKCFCRSNTLDVHIKSCHSDVRRFKCDWEGCEVALKTKLGLSIHLQRHSGEKQFRCEWEGCAYRGMTKQRLDIHYMNHTGQRPFKCNWPGCESNFTSSDCLRSHLKSHSNLRPFVCDWPGCDSAFKANRALAIHKVIHTNENLFKCNSCDFRCNRYHILASHRLSHTGGRKFLCSWPGCESKFDRRNKLELHLMIHRGDKPHECPFNGCDKRFVEKGNMRKHYNSVHSKT